MSIKVLDFRKEIGAEDINPFLKVLHDPVFNILARVNNKLRILTIEMSGDVECPSIKDLKDFDINGYRNYVVIVDFLLGEYGQKVRESWRLSKVSFRELIFALYFCLIKEYAKCGFLKKAFLIFVGLAKFYIGRKLR